MSQTSTFKEGKSNRFKAACLDDTEGHDEFQILAPWFFAEFHLQWENVRVLIEKKNL